MRISDWSSDVCSSDLAPVVQHLFERIEPGTIGFTRIGTGPTITMLIDGFLTFVVEISRRAFPREFRCIDRGFPDMPDVSVLRFDVGLHRRQPFCQGIANDPGDVSSLAVERFRRRRVEAALIEPDVELIGEAMRHGSMQRPVSILPVIVNRSPPVPFYFSNSPPQPKIARDLE